MDPASEQVVLRRVRNTLIDYLGTASSFEKQRDYQRAVPWVPVPSEVVNTYEDCVPFPSCLDEWGPPVFSMDEVDALREYSRVLDDVCDRLPDPLPSLDRVQRLPAWESLRRGASDALRVFQRRGRLDDGADGRSDV